MRFKVFEKAEEKKEDPEKEFFFKLIENPSSVEVVFVDKNGILMSSPYVLKIDKDGVYMNMSVNSDLPIKRGEDGRLAVISR